MNKLLILLIPLLLTNFQAYGNQILIITHISNKSNISIDDIKLYYSGIFFERTLADNKSIKKEFYEKLVSKNTNEVNMMWGKILFSGRGAIPIKHSNDRDIIQWLESFKEGIGYIKKSSFDPQISRKLYLIE